MSNNYDVGYRKPPEHSKFKPGQSGNNKGRPKGRKKEGILDLLNKELKSKLTLKDGRKITKAEAAIRQLCNKASGGDFKSEKLILDVTTKQQANTLAMEFLNKLIKEGYITERNAKDYLNSEKILDINSMPAAVYNLCRGRLSKQIKAEMSVTGVLFLASIWQKFFTAITTTSILETVTNEYSFWEGIDKITDALGIDKEKRIDLLSKIEKERKIKRPNDELYSAALELHVFMIFSTINSFITIREAYKTIAGYEEAEKELFGNEQQEYILSKAESQLKPSEYESVKNTIEEFKREYPSFCEFSFKMKDVVSLQKRLKKDIIHNLFDWYENASKTDLLIK
jgi:hypothetical protein